MMNTLPSLHEAIDDLYRVFEEHPLPSYTEPCLHCHTREDEAKLHSKPLRLLQWHDLESYANDALLVWGDVDTFKHFVPRLLDLYLYSYSDDPEVRFLDPEILFSKFRHAGWQSWPQEEQSAVKRLFHAIWRRLLDDPPTEESEFNLETWLCAIGQAEDDLRPYLERWARDDRDAATLALWPMMTKSYSFSAYWEDRATQIDQVKLWLMSPEVLNKVMESENRLDPTLTP